MLPCFSSFVALIHSETRRGGEEDPGIDHRERASSSEQGQSQRIVDRCDYMSFVAFDLQQIPMQGISGLISPSMSTHSSMFFDGQSQASMGNPSETSARVFDEDAISYPAPSTIGRVSSPSTRLHAPTYERLRPLQRTTCPLPT